MFQSSERMSFSALSLGFLNYIITVISTTGQANYEQDKENKWINWSHWSATVKCVNYIPNCL